ncbi:MAG: HD-GYP domain-containing protein [Parasphingorhabdus sp.]|uniref:HD-GYP domain-containing protein n=1 Tax=Parasphingorhabdus sp. TaxID=2709688 RepID=UPI00300255B7
MLHKIKTSQLELGMFISSFDGSWFEHPFWRSRFLLTEAEHLEMLISSDIDQVTIDDRKGKGLPKPSAHYQPSLARKSPARSASLMATNHQTPLTQLVGEEFQPLSRREHANEVRKASTLIKSSRTAVMSMFEDARLGNPVKLRKMAPLVDRISNSVSVDPAIILNMARLKTKDEYTYLHSIAVCALMINLARKLRLPDAQIHDIGMAGLLHDVGKTSISDNILLKPGKLTDTEWAEIRNHPQRGHDILSASAGVCDIALEVCIGHHEKMDGTGYPGNIPADNLSLFTRMSSICDIYDAITSQRSYNTPLSASRALAKMQTWSGHFDKLIFRDFVESLGILPVGTLVRMNHDELAIVIGESPSDFAAPIVRTFRSLMTDRAIIPQDIDTAANKSRRILAVQDPETFGYSDWSSFSADLLGQGPFT